MTLDPELLSAAVWRNDAAQVRDLLRGATEADRRACAQALRPMLQGLGIAVPEPILFENLGGFTAFLFAQIKGHDHHKEERASTERERDEWNQMRQGAAFLAAALGLAGGVAAAVRAADDHPSREPLPEADIDAITGVLADRHPDWLAAFADRRLAAKYQFGFDSWLIARRLVRLGAIDRPDVPQYITSLPRSLWRGAWRHPGGWRMAMTPADALLADPGLLDEEVWRLFTTPDAGRELQRLDTDGIFGGSRTATATWSDSLAVLSERGHLDRDRLVDATLDAFTRDFAPNRVAWYATFHDRMSPTPGEMAARAGRYLGLLAVTSTPGVTVGQRGCGTLLDAGLLAPDALLAASGPALLFPLKSIATAQLKLIGKIVAHQPAARALAMATAAQAFGHQREDVQEAALALIAGHGIPDDPERAVISGLADALSPSLAPDAAALGLRPAAQAGSQAAQPAAPTTALDELERRIHARPASVTSGLRSALAAARRGEVPGPAQVEPSAGRALPPPLEDPEELVQLLTLLIEDASDTLAVERALAGAVRLAALPAGDRARLAGPLLKRAEKRAREDYDGPFSGHETTADMACLALAWGGRRSAIVAHDDRPWGSEAREAVRRSGEARTMAGIPSARAWEAAKLISSGRPARLLAEPESERGAISPDRLLDRLAGWAGSPAARLPRHDLEVALLRLTPGAGDSFWSAWARVHPTSARAARRAYEEGLAPLRFEPVIGEPAGRFLGHGNGRYPHVLARMTRPSADAPGLTGSHCWTLLTALDSPLRDYHSVYGERWVLRHYDPVVAAWPLLCPWQPELAAAHLLRPLSDGLKAGPAPATTAVGGLASPGHAFGMVSHLALAAGLASAEADTRIAAAGVWSQASLDGRLDPELAAGAIVAGVTGAAFKLSRIADGLQHASPEPIAGYRIIETVFAAAEALIPAKPANLHLLFELTAQLGAATATPELPGAITGLAGQKTSSRLVAATRRLAKGCDRGPGPSRGQAIDQALGALITRTAHMGEG